jgi:hypothetical protein
VKVEVEIIGAQSGIDFQTMQQEHLLMLRIFGQELVVPVDEQTFDAIVVQAAKFTGADFEETRAAMSPESAKASLTAALQRTAPEEREFSMGSLHDVPSIADEDEEGMPSAEEMGDLFGSSDEVALPTRQAPMGASMPQLPGFGDDDGIPQG